MNPPPSQAQKAERLRSLHVPGDPLVLVNVWDAASARVVAAQPGVTAVATASWSIAAAHGADDGEALDDEIMMETIELIAAAVDLPVTADLERGYGSRPDAVARTITAAIDAGAVGGNLEDTVHDGSLRDVEDQVARLRATRAAADAAELPFVINARTDALAVQAGLDEAIARGRAYLDAGADCVFVLGLADLDDVRRAVDALGVVSMIGGPGRPSVAELADAGIARISVGPGGMGVAYAALARAASRLSAHGEYPPDLAYRPTDPAALPS